MNNEEFNEFKNELKILGNNLLNNNLSDLLIGGYKYDIAYLLTQILEKTNKDRYFLVYNLIEKYKFHVYDWQNIYFNGGFIKYILDKKKKYYPLMNIHLYILRNQNIKKTYDRNLLKIIHKFYL